PRVGPGDLLQQPEPAGGVAGPRAEGHLLAVADAQAPVHPGLLPAAGVLQRRLDPVPAYGPGRRGGEGARDDPAELVAADHRGAGRGVGVAPDDRRSFGAKSGSLLVAQERVPRQRTPSASRILRTWLQCTSIPPARAVSVSVSSVQTGAPAS